MRTLLLLLVSALLPVGLLLPWREASAPGAGLPAATDGARLAALALVVGTTVLLFLAYRLRTGLAGPGFLAAAAAGAWPAMPDGVLTPFPGPGLPVAAGGAGLLFLLGLLDRGRDPRNGPGVRWAFGAVGILGALAFLLVPGGAEAHGAPALAARTGGALLAGVLAGEAAVELARRPGLSPVVRTAAAGLLALSVAASAGLGQSRAAAWSDPLAFWERAAAEDPGSPASLGALAGLHARAEDRPRTADRLRAFHDAIAAGAGRHLSGGEARLVGAAGAASAAAFLLRDPGEGGRDLAEAALAGALALTPESAQVLWVAGEVRLREGDFAGATAHLEKAVGLDPLLPEAWETLARTRLRTGAVPGALVAAERAAGLRPGDGHFAVTHGEALLAAGREGAALTVLHRALGPKPPWPLEVALAFGEAHLKLARERIPGREGRARRLLRAGLRVAPTIEEARALLDRLDREYAAERVAMEKLLVPDAEGNVQPNDLVTFAGWLGQWGEFEEAAPYWDFLVENRGSTALVHYHRGRWFGEERETREGLELAVDAYRKAVALDPRLVEAWNHLWRCLVSLERWPEAASAAETFLRLDPGHVDALDAERLLESLKKPEPR